jgi:DNA mismatch repair protein PMS2
VHLKTTGALGVRGAVSALWGPKSLDPLVELDLAFDVALDDLATKRLKAYREDKEDS